MSDYFPLSTIANTLITRSKKLKRKNCCKKMVNPEKQIPTSVQAASGIELTHVPTCIAKTRSRRVYRSMFERA
ncbi:hypothetical protein WN51_08182 [Melipona quadrifasciata]|uniref:Uncharacterized protein n=1 Tax=Melipona quadrifasciata TaxID=166423 RepID=A0A0N0U391_9HYME|nr:hypothetical protein WN51_08182 [Melipona quadrifasciata]